MYCTQYYNFRLVEGMALNRRRLFGRGSALPHPVRAMECPERWRPRLPTGGEYCYSLWPLQSTIYQVYMYFNFCHPLILWMENVSVNHIKYRIYANKAQELINLHPGMQVSDS